MRIGIFKTVDEVAGVTIKELIDVLSVANVKTVGVATGSTPLALYARIRDAHASIFASGGIPSDAVSAARSSMEYTIDYGVLATPTRNIKCTFYPAGDGNAPEMTCEFNHGGEPTGYL